MRRGKPLRRGEPLRRKTPLRSAGSRRSGRSTGPAGEVAEAVYERAQHCCEICADGLGPVRGVDHHIHHRRPRAAGGSRRPDTNLPSNLLLLCPPCHDRVESYRAVAQLAGWLLSQVCDPAATPVRLAGPTWRYLTADGRYSEHPPRRTS